MPHLISPPELAAALRSDAPPALLDVRWALDTPDGRSAHRAGHLPGAVYVSLDDDLADRSDPAAGRHPLPGRERLQEAARRWGLAAGVDVVVYDDVPSIAAARAWWLLSHSGVSVRVLDGGLRGWIAAGLPLEEGDVVPPYGDIELTAVEEGWIGIDEAAAWPEEGVLLDVRAPERYRGESEPIDPVGGHIPGAVNLPVGLLSEGGRLRPADGLRAVFRDAGVEEGTRVAAYCGSGVAATQAALAGAVAGIDVVVFPGSWSQWSRSSGRLVATGPDPDRDVRPL